MKKIFSHDCKILIVDDNPENIQVLGKLLQNEDYSVDFAMDGQAALEWVDKKDFDLILLDVMMPEMNGFEVCERIKADPEKQKIPVVFLTAKTDLESTIKGFCAGAVDYVNKPFNKEELLARVSTQLELKKARDEIELKNKLITSSINYAEKIQHAVLQSGIKSPGGTHEYFIYFRPKDIVSGDFYWFNKVDDKFIVAVMDCTGHGIPGAFMSMLGFTLLNEVVVRDRITDPGKILNRLREFVIRTLGQKGIISEVHDGMDGAIISFDWENGSLQFSGANNPLYLIRDNEIIEFKGDRMPLAYYEKMTDFNNHEIQVKENDMICLFTDGFIDQFGGEYGKKFKASSFKQLLLDIHKNPIEDIEQMLEDKFTEWKGDREQVDDVTVVGIRI